MYKMFWKPDPKAGREFIHMRDSSHIGDRWMDITVNVRYRDADGFLRHRDESLPLEW
jgi:hypothetical protein